MLGGGVVLFGEFFFWPKFPLNILRSFFSSTLFLERGKIQDLVLISLFGLHSFFVDYYRVFANGPRDQGSIPDRHTKDLKNGT